MRRGAPLAEHCPPRQRALAPAREPDRLVERSEAVGELELVRLGAPRNSTQGQPLGRGFPRARAASVSSRGSISRTPGRTRGGSTPWRPRTRATTGTRPRGPATRARACGAVRERAGAAEPRGGTRGPPPSSRATGPGGPSQRSAFSGSLPRALLQILERRRERTPPRRSRAGGACAPVLGAALRDPRFALKAASKPSGISITGASTRSRTVMSSPAACASRSRPADRRGRARRSTSCGPRRAARAVVSTSLALGEQHVRKRGVLTADERADAHAELALADEWQRADERAVAGGQ